MKTIYQVRTKYPFNLNNESQLLDEYDNYEDAKKRLDEIYESFKGTWWNPTWVGEDCFYTCDEGILDDYYICKKA